MPIIRAILFSFAFHTLLILAGIFLVPMLAKESNSTPIEISITSPTMPPKAAKVQQGTVVKNVMVPERLKVPEDETMARFFSENKQRVKQETQAAKIGATENRSDLGVGDSGRKREQQKVTREEKSTDKDGFRSVDISKELQELNRLNSGESTIGTTMPNDVRVGSFTALNTDRHLYYSFYNRVDTAIRYRWESRIQNALNALGHAALVNLSNQNWTTNIEFLLDENGYVKKALIMKESGVLPFDTSAVRAFEEAAVFPNPPKEMVQEDGYIHLKYSFSVLFRPPTLVNANDRDNRSN